ncbi:hypothetical protein [Rhodococcus sp. NPDC127528]|uniref:hypothetical protein n=1 Tax=unclassified Rhodococcus (in: high G+C Gram-positive bacteria) TaxID=192944 RepID=UPI00363BCE1C
MGVPRWGLMLVACGAVVLTAACGTTVGGNASPTAEPMATSTPPATPPTRTAAPTTTKAVPAAQVADYAGTQAGSYYFTSPSSKFECAIVTARQPVAGCHGAFPPNAPQVKGSGAPGPVTPNSIRVAADRPGEFFSAGDPAFHRFDGTAKVLPYGSPLRVQGFTCTVDERTGVTCETAGHGFTVSDNAFRLW